MKSSPETLKKLSEKSKKIIWFLGLHAFAFLLMLILIDILIGGFVFYKYILPAEHEVPAVTQSLIKFNDKKYQDVFLELQGRVNNQ